MRTCLAFALLTFAVGASAQPDWRPTPADPSVSVDVLAALGDDLTFTAITDTGEELGNSTVETITSALLLSGRMPVGPVTLTGEIPFGFVRYTYDNLAAQVIGEDYSASDAALGNPYLGLATSTGGLEVEIGARLPLASLEPYTVGAPYADATVVGPTLDPERFEAYASDLFSSSLTVRYGRALAPGLRADARLAPIALIEVGDAPDCPACDTVTNPADAALGYGLRLTGTAGPAAFHAGIAGRRFLTTERYDHLDVGATVVLGATLVRAPVQPGVLVRIPLDTDDYFGTDAVVGISLTLAR